MMMIVAHTITETSFPFRMGSKELSSMERLREDIIDRQ
jgi:hypothetical protein